jgi:hypothetical protein
MCWYWIPPHWYTCLLSESEREANGAFPKSIMTQRERHVYEIRRFIDHKEILDNVYKGHRFQGTVYDASCVDPGTQALNEF